MKKFKKSLIALGILLSMQSFALDKGLKPLKSENKNEVVIDLAQFGKYLGQENSKTAEGVYSTEDGRYVVAIVKNEEKTHDYIGVVISADNPYWKAGEIKFNFVLNQENKLEGYYYDSIGVEHHISFSVNKEGIVCDFLKKVNIEELKNQGLALR